MSIVHLPEELLSRVLGRQVGKVCVVNVKINLDPSEATFCADIPFSVETVDAARSSSDLAAMNDALDALRLVNGAPVSSTHLTLPTILLV